MKIRMAALLCSTATIMTLGAAKAAVPSAPPARPLAADSYADLLKPVPHAVEALKADDAARALAPQARVQLAQYHHHHHHHHHHGGFFPGFVIGSAIGGLMAAQPDYGPPPPYSPGVRWCMRHYRSYDPRSGTYLGYDGYRHPCP